MQFFSPIFIIHFPKILIFNYSHNLFYLLFLIKYFFYSKMDTSDPVLKLISSKWRPMVVISAGIVLQFTYGLVYTFGNLLPYLASYLRWKVDPYQTQGSLIWLQSLMSGFPFAMLTGGYLERLIGARWGATLGSLLYTGGIVLSFWSIKESYFLLILTLGLIGSFGTGVAYNCVLIQSQKWLPHRVGLVSELITAGFGSGAFIISPIQTKFINPANLNVDQNGFFDQDELLERVPKLFLLLALIFGILQFLALFFIADPNIPIGRGNKANHEEAEDEEDAPIMHSPLRSLLPRNSIASFTSYSSCVHYQAPTLSARKVLTSGTFACLFFTLLLNGIWCQTTSGFFKAYGQTFIHDDFFLATLNSFAAAMNCISRIFWGHFADKSSYPITMSIACALGAALMWTLGIVEQIGSPMLYFIWICAMFCCVGATYSLIPYATHKCFGSENFGIAYGCIQLSLFISGLITALCSQFLLNLIGFHLMFTFVAGTMFISLLLTIYLPYTVYGAPCA